jgi:hypothetical protein
MLATLFDRRAFGMQLLLALLQTKGRSEKRIGRVKQRIPKNSGLVPIYNESFQSL